MPSLHLLVLVVIQPQQDQIGHFVEDEEVSNGDLIPCDELCLALGEDGLKSSDGLEQTVDQCLLLLFLHWLLAGQSHQQISDRSDHEMPEVVLIPRDVLIGYGSLFQCLTIVNGQIGISLTEVDHDGSTFTQHEVSSLQDWDLADGIHVSVGLLLLLAPEQVDLVEGTGDLADVDEGLDCPRRLADDVPVESDVSHGYDAIGI